MLSNYRISFVKSLHQKKKRRELGLFLAEGDKLVREYLLSGFEVKEIYAEADWLRAHSELIKNETETFAAKPNELERITTLVTAPPVIAVVQIPEIRVTPGECVNGLTLVLDGIRDPGNMGTIIRTADWFGITRVIASDDCAEEWNPKVVQASMGSLTRVRVMVQQPEHFIGSVTEAARELKQAAPEVYGTFMNGENVYNARLSENAIIIIGNEANGIRETTEKFITRRIGVPDFASGVNKPESLNAGIAAALVLSEFKRREQD